MKTIIITLIALLLVQGAFSTCTDGAPDSPCLECAAAPNANKCSTCVAGNGLKADATDCEACGTGNVTNINSTACVASCDAGQWKDTEGKICKTCSSIDAANMKCNACTNGTVCTGCMDGFYLANATGCANCTIANCAACTSATACTKCNNKYLAVDKASCLDDCPSGQTKDTTNWMCKTSSSFGSLKFVAGALFLLLAMLF